jgi:hypothetical protein
MLRWLINRRLTAEEKKLGVSLDYARDILHSSLRAFLTFSKTMPLAAYRRTLPAEPFYLARIVATRQDDCGECLQIVVNQAKNAGIRPALLRAVLADRLEELPVDVAEACLFASAIVTAGDAVDALRERLRGRFGEEALVELAMTIAAARIFPALKRALGHANSCAVTSIHV